MKLDKDFSKHLAAFNSRKVYLESNPSVIYLESVKGCPLSWAMCQNKRTNEYDRYSFDKKARRSIENMPAFWIEGRNIAKSPCD